MNNLIINGIDHSKFDLEWAKRGGRLICEHEGGERTLGVLSLTGDSIETGTLLFGVIPIWQENQQWIARMATPAECAEAGIEYIEYHGWRPIGTAPLDTLVIVETDQKKVGCAIFESRNESEHFGLGSFASRYRNWMPMPQPQKDE